jgi:hypothetical protein
MPLISLITRCATGEGRSARVVTALGCGAAVVSGLAGLAYFAERLATAQSLTAGNTPLILGLVFMGAVQVASLGIIAEYVQSLPKERLGF